VPADITTYPDCGRRKSGQTILPNAYILFFCPAREDRGRPGWERLRMICAHSTLAWRRQDGALWID